MTAKIFINYRRGDDPGFTGRLFDRLRKVFKADELFMDVDNIAPELDFTKVLDEQVNQCDVVLVVIGRSWLHTTDDAKQRRLENPADFVRIEIESALNRGKRVIPVLVNDAQMPLADDLPESLKPLAHRNAVRLSHDRFRDDSAGLIRALKSALTEEAKKREQEAQREIQAEERRRAEVEARRQAEGERRRQAEAQRLAEEDQRLAEEDQRRQAEAEARRQAEEERRRQAEAEARRQAEEERRRQAEAEAQRLAEEEQRRQAEAEAARIERDRAEAGPVRGRQMGRIALALEDERILGFVLLSPALILILIFIAYPFVLGIWMSLTDKLVGTPGDFVGLANYTRLLDSDIFRTAAWNTVFFTFMATVFKAALGMWLAVLLNRKFRLARITRATVLLPFIVPTVLSTLAWLWMFDATFSVFNWVLRWLWQMEIGLFGIVLKENWGFFSGPLWLGDPGWAMFSVILVNVWRGLPFFAISFLAGLQTIPQELYDAADLDGATGWRKFWHVTLPMIKPVAIVVVVFSVVITFADFQLVYILTRGGPNNETHLLATLAYQLGMTSGNIGQGAAVALYMLPILATVIVIQLWYLRRQGVR